LAGRGDNPVLFDWKDRQITTMTFRILFVCTLDTGWGGSEFLWTETAKALARRGIEVHAILNYRKPEPRTLQELRQCGVSVSIQNAPPPLPPKANILRRASRKILRALSRPLPPFAPHEFVKSIDPNLVVISQPSSVEGFEWMMACKQTGTLYSTISHACHDQLFGDDKDAEFLKPALLSTHRSYFVCRENQKRMEHFFGERYTNAEIVRNPFNVPFETSYSWPIDTTPLRIANVARLHVPSKGQDVLLELLAQEKWKNRPIILSIYGTGPNEQGLRRLAGLLGLDNVRFHGHVDNILDIWQNNHVLVLPSRYEGLPIALIEAMLCGRPAVVTNVSGNPEVMLPEQTGYISEAPTVQSLDHALELLWQRKEKLQDLGRNAYNHIRTLIPSNPAEAFADCLLFSIQHQ
jgi:glycosyltransferase involved in cell wall biosynthesis